MLVIIKTITIVIIGNKYRKNGEKMRIITGKYRGKKLACLNDETIRPTLDRVKETLFDILQFRIANCRAIDLFAGSGSLGIECISRGASEVVFADINPKCIELIKSNLLSLKLDIMPQVCYRGWFDALNANRKTKFDIIFIDPPYKSGNYYDVLKRINDLNVLADEGVIAVEHDAYDPICDGVGNLQKYKETKIGSVLLSFYSLVKPELVAINE
ncbi:MAG: 16S rRNA (guanine(966)-N(2))-methyltransferase RsmD [Clostridia bacterium]